MKKNTEFQDYNALKAWATNAVSRGALSEKIKNLPQLKFTDTTLKPLALHVNGDTVPKTAEEVQNATSISLVYSTFKGEARIEVGPDNTAKVSSWVASDQRGLEHSHGRLKLGENGVTSCFKEALTTDKKLYKSISDLDLDLFRISVLYFMDSQGTNIHTLAKNAGVDDSGLSKFLKGSIRPDGNKVQLDSAGCLSVCRALGAKNFRALYAMGEQASQENPLDKNRLRSAVLNLMREQNIRPGDLANSTHINQGNLYTFLQNDGFLSAENCHLLREVFGAQNFRELYAMGGVPIETPAPTIPTVAERKLANLIDSVHVNAVKNEGRINGGNLSEIAPER